MAAATGGMGLLHSSSSQQLEPACSSPNAKAKAKATPTAKLLTRPRVVRPRIDIDDQISEANRVHDLLRKMSQAAKSLKKTQTMAKQRLIKKAARLNPADLERIAVLKQSFGIQRKRRPLRRLSVPVPNHRLPVVQREPSTCTARSAIC